MTNLNVSHTTSGSSTDTTDSSSTSSSSSSSSPSSSSDSDSSASDTPAVPPSPKSPESPSNNNKDDFSNKKNDRTRRSSIKAKPSSSSDSDTQLKEILRTPPRRRPSIKRNSVTNNKINSKPINRSQTVNKNAKQTPKKEAQTPRRPETRNSSLNRKKKSIFSPDNSSESDSEDKSKSSSSVSISKSSSNSNNNNKPSPKSASILRSRGRTRKSSSDKLSTPEKKVVRNKNLNNVKRRSGSRTNGPPPKKPVEDKASTTTNNTSSSSSQSSSDLDTPSPSSDSGSSKKESIKSSKTNKTTSRTSSSSLSKSTSSNASIASTTSNSKTIEAILRLEGEVEVPRKLTRSLSARVSRLAAATKVTHTDTDSEPDDKAEYYIEYKSNGTKKILRSPPPPPPPPLEPLEPKERRCPVRGCDSLGHLGGLSEKHFTFDACPTYHNVTPAWCVAAEEERGAAAIARDKATQAMEQRPRSQPTIEQRAYQLKVKDMRSKWKGSDDKDRGAAETSTSDDLTIDREPQLEGFTPDYDLRLFREAQALAANKIEEELGDLPTDRGTRYVVMGKYMMEVWYQSPYPGEAARVPRLFVCEFCLQHQQSKAGSARHKSKCLWQHPPGDEVYRKENLSVWQVDGRKHKQYCQQLCLLAKFFLDHKTLYYDVEPFLFYVMTLADEEGCHIVGYFSKEKNSFLNYNVSCILTLPPYQRQGYGRLLIDFSYLLTKVEGKVGSPETPLSDLGLISYRSYWKETLLRRLCSASGPSLNIRDLSKDLGISSCDIVSTLQERGLMKYWKGKHIVLKKQEVLEEMSRRSERARSVDPSCLRWTPPAAPPPR